MGNKKQLLKIEETYQVGELVFVRMRGYSKWWPSRIIEVSNNRVKVFFFGCLGQV